MVLALAGLAPAAAVGAINVTIAVTASADSVLPLPGVPLAVTVTPNLDAGRTVKSVSVTASGCAVVQATIVSTHVVLNCPAGLRTTTIRASVQDDLARSGSAALTQALATTAVPAGLRVRATSGACTSSFGLEVSAATTSGAPIAGLTATMVMTGPAGQTQPAVTLTPTNFDGAATVNAGALTGWTATFTTRAAGIWPAMTSAPFPLTPDVCDLHLRLTSQPASRVAYATSQSFSGIVEAVRQDGAAFPWRGATVTLTQVIPTKTGPQTITVATSSTTPVNGTWNVTATFVYTGPVTLTATTSSSTLRTKTDSVNIGQVAAVQYLATLRAEVKPATAGASTIQAGDMVNVSGTLSAPDPITGAAAPAAMNGISVDVGFTPTGGTGTQYLGTARTAAGGTWSLPVTSSSNGTYTASLPAKTLKAVAAPTSTQVNVVGRTALVLASKEVNKGDSSGIRVLLAPYRRTANIDVMIAPLGTSSWTRLATFKPGTRTFTAPAAAGKYQLKSVWSGDSLSGASESPIVTLSVLTAAPTVRPGNLQCHSYLSAPPTCTWDAPAGVVVSGYKVYSGSVLQTDGALDQTSWTAGTSFPYGISSTITVKGSTSAGDTPASKSAPALRLAAPAALSVTDQQPTSLSVTWKPVTGAAGYSVTVDDNDPVDVEASVLSFTSSDLEPGTTHTFSVSAFSAEGDTSLPVSLSPSTGIPVRGGAPAGLKCTSPTIGQVTCTWIAVPSATGYKVYLNGSVVVANISSEYPFPEPVNGVVRSTGASLTGLSAGSMAALTVTAVDQDTESAYSNAVQVKVSAPTPTLGTPLPRVSANSTAQSSSTLTWDAVPGATSYSVYPDGQPMMTVNGTSVTLSALAGSRTTSVGVVANATGYNPSLRAGVNVRPTTTTVPESLTCTSSIVSQVYCRWSAVPSASGYHVYVNGVLVTNGLYADQNWPSPVSGLVRSTGGTIANLAYGTNVTITVTAVTGSGESAASDAVRLVVFGPALAAPAPVLSQLSDGVYLTWQAVPGASSYNISLPGAANMQVSDTRWKLAGLTGTSLQYVRVQATAAARIPSVWASVHMTGDLAPLLDCTSSTVGAAWCQWSAVTGATGYLIKRDGMATALSPEFPWTLTTTSGDDDAAGSNRSTTRTTTLATAGLLSGLTPGANITLTLYAVVNGKLVLKGTSVLTVYGPALDAPVLSLTTDTTGPVITWPAIDGATSYTVSVPGSGLVTTTTPSWKVTGLAPSSVVAVRVQATSPSRIPSTWTVLRVKTDTDGRALADLQCSSPSVSAAVCAWSAAPGASGYHLWRDGVLVTSMSPEYPWPAHVNGLTMATGVSVTSLPSGATTTFSVTAVIDGADTPWAATTITLMSPPAPKLNAPVPYQSAASGTSLSISWDAVVGATTYRASLTDGVTTLTCTTSGLTCSFTGLTSGTVYVASVYATGAGYQDSAAASLRVNPGAAPI